MRTGLVDHPLDPTALLAEVADVGSGASTIFVGTVRRSNQGRAVTGIDYSAYAPMAEAEMRRIAEEAVARFGTPHIVIEHRLGTLSLGEASIAIAVSHERRAAAMDAQRYIIEEFKARVPIWKREHYVDGDRAWVDNQGGAVAAEPDAAVADSSDV